MKKFRGRVTLPAVVVSLLVIAAFAGKGNEEPTSTLSFLVLKENGKPMKGASVILHPVNAKGKQERGGYQLKTDPDGKTSFDGVPYGKLRVQVLAPGFQTYGEDYDIEHAEMKITIQLKRPHSQYSIYDNLPNEKSEDKKPDHPQQDPGPKPQ